MTTTTTGTTFSAIDWFTPPSLRETPAAALRRLREQAPAFREWFRGTGELTAMRTMPLITLPYPRAFGLWEACTAKAPFLWITNRVFVVQWMDGEVLRTALVGPTDWELGDRTPYFATLRKSLPVSEARATKLLSKPHATVAEQLVTLGIRRENVDYLVFDHLHTQDVRRLIGTTAPAPDLDSTGRPVPALFPNAKLVVQKVELEHTRDVHPFQARFEQANGLRDIDESKLIVVDGDVLLGPGLALLRTPGHTLGNTTIVMNVPGRGIFTTSENGIAVDAYAPEHSDLPGVRKWQRTWGYEVILNYNTPEFASWQYNSMMVEKLVADRVPNQPWPQCLPSSELTKHRFAPRIHATYSHGDIAAGKLVTAD